MLLVLLAVIAVTGLVRQASGAAFPELTNSLVRSWKPSGATVAFEDVQVIGQSAYITDAQLGQAYTTGIVYELIVQNDVAFTRVGANHLECFSVATPSSPVPTGSFVTYTGVSDFDVAGTRLCLGNSSALVLLDITSINSPVERDRIAFAGSLSVEMEGNFIYACVTVSGTAHYLKIINATVPTDLQEIASLDLGSYYVDSMLLSGDTLFTSGRDYALASPTGGTVKAYDVANKSAPALLSAVNAGGISNVGLMLSGTALYTGACGEGLVVIEALSPAQLQPIGVYDDYQNTCGGEHYALHPQALVDATRGKLVVFASMGCGLNIVAFNSFEFPMPIETIIIITIVIVGGIGGGVAIIISVVKAHKP
jgi:hypothetical protein